MLLGDVGEDSPLQPENSVASVALEATWQALSQNRRRETNVFVSDIAWILLERACRPSGWVGKIEATRGRACFQPVLANPSCLVGSRRSPGAGVDG
jgi:hypothetical protein